MVAGVLLGVATFLAFPADNPFGFDPDDFLLIVLADVALVLVLGMTVIWTVVRLWSERRAGAAGARLHVRVAALFSVVAIATAIQIGRASLRARVCLYV